MMILSCKVNIFCSNLLTDQYNTRDLHAKVRHKEQVAIINHYSLHSDMLDTHV